MENTFLPKDYKLPESSSGGYTKLVKGENRFRIMSSPIIGYEWWEDERGNVMPKNAPFTPGSNVKPVRVKTAAEINPDAINSAIHFWAFTVWNYATEAVEILELKQKSILAMLTSLSQDVDWGSPVGENGYDVVINKTGEGKDNTRYEVTPKPRKQLAKEIVDMVKDKDIDLESLYTGGNPFESKTAKNVVEAFVA